MNDFKYYDLNSTLSRGAILTFIIGQRGTGKTYSFKEWAIKDFLKTGSQFIYLRRLDSESLIIKSTLFDDIAHKYGMSVKCRGSVFKIRPIKPLNLTDKELKKWEKENPWKEFGYSMSLNLQQDYKSGSWPLVNKLCFDEIIIENNSRKYINGSEEPSIFINLLSTVFRNRKMKAVLLSNAGAIYNPYFSYYDIRSDELSQEMIKRKSGAVLIHNYKNKENSKILKQGLMGKLGNEDYIKYAIDSEFRDIDSDMIVPINEVKIDGLYFNISMKSGKNYIIKSTEDNRLYAQIGYNKSLPTYSIESNNTKFVYNKEVVSIIKDGFYRKRLLFDSIDTRLDLIDHINI